MFHRSLQMCIIILILIGTGLAADVPFVFDENASGVAGYSSDQIEQAYATSPDLAGVPLISMPSDDEVLVFPVTGGGNSPRGISEKNTGDLKKTFNIRVEPDNSRVHEEALVLVSRFPGDLTIDQISSIYNYLKNGQGSIKGWSYARDPRGIDYYMFANESLKIGERAGCAGTGDCDDFAILMSALMESIGGTTRIVLAHNNSTGGHAYSEVYLGRLNATDNKVAEIIRWLSQKFNADKIYVHIDTDSMDVWLNLDWSADHPGGPFYSGDKHMVLCIRDQFDKTPLKPPENFNAELNAANQFQPAEIDTVEVAMSAGNKKDETNIPEEDETTNPAIARCISLGNIYANGQCTFPGGSSCDVWVFYRGDCILTGKKHG